MKIMDGVVYENDGAQVLSMTRIGATGDTRTAVVNSNAFETLSTVETKVKQETGLFSYIRSFF